jgi:cell division protease FtsH
MVMSEDEKKLTAYHESGHAIVGRLVPDARSGAQGQHHPARRALGVTLFLPEDDRFSYSKQRLESQISSLFGGGLAEELIFGVDMVTTGASNDIQRATEIARNMVTKWGLSDKLGPLTYSEDEQEVFLGHSVTQHKRCRTRPTHLIDKEVRGTSSTATTIGPRPSCWSNMDKLHAMADALMKYETIDALMVISTLVETRQFAERSIWWKRVRTSSISVVSQHVRARRQCRFPRSWTGCSLLSRRLLQRLMCRFRLTPSSQR